MLPLNESSCISQHKISPFDSLIPTAANPEEGGCTALQDTMKCVNCVPQRPQILSQTLLHLRFRSWQWQMNVWKGTLRVDGGAAALPEADRVICQTEKAVNLLHPLSYPHV